VTSQHPQPAATQAGDHVRAIIGGLFILALLWLVPDPGIAVAPGSPVLEHGRVVSLVPADAETGIVRAQVEILDGERAGRRVTADIAGPTAAGRVPAGGAAGSGAEYAPGDEVVLQISTGPEGEFIAISDRWRVPLLAAVVVIFGLLVTVVAGWRGVRALVALTFTVGVAYKILLPLLIAGWDPVVLAVLTGSGVTLVTLLLTEGWRRSTFAAVAGTFAALLATALIAAAVTATARFSVLQGSEDVGFLQGMIGLDVDLGGLLLASVILGALGVLDDVTITQAVTIEELIRSDPAASRGTIVARAMNIGRSHIAATVNTLVLAYVAASLPLLLLFALAAQPIGALASSETVAVEIVRAVVGSMGIVLAVPFTTFVAVRIARRERTPTAPAPGPAIAMARPMDDEPTR
jgi:uncharacterized membrane protein